MYILPVVVSEERPGDAGPGRGQAQGALHSRPLQLHTLLGGRQPPSGLLLSLLRMWDDLF